MENDKVFIGLGIAFAVLLALTILIWAVWVRPFLKVSGTRTASNGSLADLIADLSTGLIYSRGRIHGSLKLLGLLLTLLACDLILFLLFLLFGS